MKTRTYDQKMAEKAFQCVNGNERGKGKKYCSFALSFPSLVHSCGLAQAVSFAEAKKMTDYLKDLNEVLTVSLEEGSTVDYLLSESREAQVVDYMRLTRRAISAASWIKRYVHAFEEEAASDDTSLS